MTTIRLRLLSQRKNVSSDYSVLKARPSFARQNRDSWKTASVAKRNPAVVANDFKSWIAVKTLDKVEQKCYTEPVILVGDDDGEVPPVPIPNTEVKLTCAQDSSLETARENR